MTYIDAIILGIIQGLTEFLPVSSSGHLVLAEAILGVKQPGVAFEVMVHLGTLVAVIIYYRQRLAQSTRAGLNVAAAVTTATKNGKPLEFRSCLNKSLIADQKMLWYLFIGTIPAGVAGVAFEKFFERAFGNPVSTSIEIMITGLLLLATRFFRRGNKPIDNKKSLIMGIGQAVAIMPGISRSGSTIAAGIFWGINPAVAAEFSFLLSIPAIGGAILLKAKEMFHVSPDLMGPYVVATGVSFVFGMASVYALLAVVRRGKLDYFAYYCFAAGLLGLYLFL